MTEKHAQRAGIVTNVNPFYWPENTRNRAFSSSTVCGRLECIQKEIRLVSARTKETARFYPDKAMGGQFTDGPHEWTMVETFTPFLTGPTRLVWECTECDTPHRAETIVPGTW